MHGINVCIVWAVMTQYGRNSYANGSPEIMVLHMV